MIRPIQSGDIASLYCSDPFFTRICSLYESYGEGYNFVGFWAQEREGEAVALVSRFEDKFSLYLTADCDKEELGAFLSFQGAGAVMHNAKTCLNLPKQTEICGEVLRFAGEEYTSDLELYIPEIKAVHQLLCTCESEIFRVPEYMSFLSDVTHRKNKGKCVLVGTDVDAVLASFVMTVSESKSAVIIGAVATHPDYRKRGLSRELVRSLSSKIKKEGREVFVFSASKENTKFYQNSGFEIAAKFKEIFLR